MRAFFHGWQRKVGAVALLLACLFMGVWMRSLVAKVRLNFSDFTGFAKKDKQLAGLAADRQSLVLLVYKVKEVECRMNGTSVTYSSAASQSETEYAETQPASVAELSTTMLSLQPMTDQLPVTKATDSPTKATNSAIGGQSTPLVGVVVNSNFTPLPASMVNDSEVDISIRTKSTDPLVSVLTATSEVPLVAIPFWSIVFPLAMLAAYLLLTKPRELTQKIPPNSWQKNDMNHQGANRIVNN